MCLLYCMRIVCACASLAVSVMCAPVVSIVDCVVGIRLWCLDVGVCKCSYRV